MKFIVISDSHGRYERIGTVMDMHRDADALIFLGDGIADLDRADAYSRGMTVFAVRGNCDGQSFLQKSKAPLYCNHTNRVCSRCCKIVFAICS